MRKYTTILLTCLISFTVSDVMSSEKVTWEDLFERDGVYYKKGTTLPFSGELTGYQKGRFKDGKAEGTWILCWSNGRVNIVETFKNGEREGPWSKYHGDSNGRLWATVNYKNGVGHGRWFEYYPEGMLRNTVNYINGSAEGPFIHYHTNGDLREKGTYTNGKRDGVWIIVDYFGTRSERIYNNGRIIKEIIIEKKEWSSVKIEAEKKRLWNKALNIMKESDGQKLDGCSIGR